MEVGVLVRGQKKKNAPLKQLSFPLSDQSMQHKIESMGRKEK